MIGAGVRIRNVNRYLLQKHGSDLRDCEDSISFSISKARFCVADGATEAFDSKTWAKLLTRAWILLGKAERPSDDFWDLVSGAASRLHTRWSKRILPWYAEEKAKSGSFAAFIGLQFSVSNSNSLCWSALAIGDCCLVQLRGGVLRESFPIEKAADFGSRPQLLPSCEHYWASAKDHLVSRTSAAESGDIFFLMSDAVAQWFLYASSTMDSSAAKFEALLSQSKHKELDALVNELRGLNLMRNDDVAVLRIEVD